MRGNISSSGRGKKILPAILIVANLLMLVIGVFTIPPNLQSAAKKESPVPRVEQTSPVTPSPEETGASLSTEERPALEDFLWYTEDVIENGVPEGAQIIDSAEFVLGGWKGFILYDPNNNYGANSAELLNVDISGTGEELRLTLDWYLMLIPGETQAYDETDMDDVVFDGEWIGGGIQTFGWGELRLRRLYALEGKQYAFGSLETPDGIPALVALVRP
jgi:hypothetical protein